MKANLRINFILIAFLVVGFLVEAKLFYWQVLAADKLVAAAQQQYWVSFEIPAQRGKILASDGFPLTTNKESFLAFASLPDLKQEPLKVAESLAPILSDKISEITSMIEQRLSRKDLVWVPLKHKISSEAKEAIEKLNLSGIGFEKEMSRSYPEGSGSAHLLGFVGSDLNGQEKGYFGLEGFYDLELKGRPGVLRREKDASGKPILVGEVKSEDKKDGRDIITNIDRSVQLLIEEKLNEGMRRYGAISGSIVVMNPKTGAILGMVSLPNYDPQNYSQFEKTLYPNPIIASSYEPGSTFKVVVMAAALNEGVVDPETRCDQCSGPRQFGEYTIKTWNEKYYPNSTMREVIQHSDNVGMVFVAEKLGKDKLVDYLAKFGFGELTGIDLQEESSALLRPQKEWREIDQATASFGQGIAITPIQMLMAVGAIANQGQLMRPQMVKEVIGEQGPIEIKPEAKNKVISPAAARLMTEMMVNAVDNGEAKWAKPSGFKIAGKTGTAQIPVAGHYDKDKTIASFVGFAPAYNTKFVMLVTLQEPKTSPWGSETAAPLWFDIAKELFLYYGISPE